MNENNVEFLTKEEYASKEYQDVKRKFLKLFAICDCQRNISNIITALLKLKNDIIADNDFTNEQYVLIALLDTKTDLITHGINQQYPILNNVDEFWNKLEDWQKIAHSPEC